MAKASYPKAQELRHRCTESAAQLRTQLSSFKVDILAFYEMMRWQGVDCSEEEYEHLLENLIHEFESCNVEYALNQLERFLSGVVSESSA